MKNAIAKSCFINAGGLFLKKTLSLRQLKGKEPGEENFIFLNQLIYKFKKKNSLIFVN